MKKYSLIIVFSFLFVAFLLGFQSILAVTTAPVNTLTGSQTIAWNESPGATSYNLRVYKEGKLFLKKRRFHFSMMIAKNLYAYDLK